MKPIISIQDVTYTYPRVKHPTIRQINLDIYPGEKILIAGPSGSGKSTLARCINGLIPHSYKGELQGAVMIDGKPITEMPIVEISEKVGTILQDPEGQFIGLSVAEDVAFGLENREVPQREMEVQVKAALERVGMVQYMDGSPQELSGGEKQKVALAGILTIDPEVLLLDEPLANLDPVSGLQMMELMERIHKQAGKTVIIVEHRIEDVIAYGVDRIVLMVDGAIVADLPAAQMLSSGLLKEAGIRHPLYLEALHQVGCSYTADDLPLRVDEVDVEETAPIVSRWLSNGENEASIEAASGHDRNTDETLPIISFHGVHFGYEPHVQVLSEVSFAIQPGERVALLGHNGAGKSTLSQLMLGMYQPTKGSIAINGKNASGMNIAERGRQIGYVMQNPNHMLSQDTVLAEILLGPKHSGFSQEEIGRSVDHALAICDLAGYRNWPISALSHGQKKRLTIASVLAMNPKLLLLDEPTAGQDYRHYREMMAFIDGLSKQGIALVMVTHDMHLAMEYTDRALVLSKGRIVADTSTMALLANEDRLTGSQLRPSSLYELGKRLALKQPDRLIRRYIAEERKGSAQYEEA
ncbi:DUF3744 domain-containing protein [Paenibacillus solisilvae]|uniref:DUF3744 domain-containing protein n=1 Tax=Paenibacillus solisilvae TaxID=2486751 RepID=A0ABW0VYG9_9BACL